ncbi:MAG TPA: biotin--[acetyl-CoA-carboxylase] ligase [Acidimicrobiia bacterium]|nr:biotin--[acetyl-CoA-carboxylase] ligase [Acidimicrobiia bacterium]
MAPPYSVIRRERTDSTQDDARAAFVDAPVLVVAAGQRKGRGRSASDWQTAPRAMAASLALRPDWEATDLPLISLLAGVAAARVVDCGLKWPNDVYRDGSKLGGILVEASDGVLVVGFGLNLWWPEAPAGVTAVHQEDPGPSAAGEIAERWADELLALVAAGAAAWPREEYRARSITLGRQISWNPSGQGKAVDIAADGGLVVVTDGVRRTLHAGEVRHVR